MPRKFLGGLTLVIASPRKESNVLVVSIVLLHVDKGRTVAEPPQVIGSLNLDGTCLDHIDLFTGRQPDQSGYCDQSHCNTTTHQKSPSATWRHRRPSDLHMSTTRLRSSNTATTLYLPRM